MIHLSVAAFPLIDPIVHLGVVPVINLGAWVGIGFVAVSLLGACLFTKAIVRSIHSALRRAKPTGARSGGRVSSVERWTIHWRYTIPPEQEEAPIHARP